MKRRIHVCIGDECLEQYGGWFKLFVALLVVLPRGGQVIAGEPVTNQEEE